ncbi:LPS-assembly protein lptD-Organic solvent tolerance protein [Moritella viscosa]|uniref:LPS-assembly protein LptD n=2 Tax=Moritella viscosa TaxID=80854 RepID=A0A1K9ZRU4_9GAMM|nr:LPS-assembly protein lptD-Organic solvent tolerance protein [Moritella viscosa]SHO05654.1 LPS-assembly protein lptD-Organic solvent tolerance protein [Moritella viscosa]SHO05670.1 LPS-assembly protein lptD-Organic solvent tolerance protein [Moritella viscosa]SHO08991.1 LPS-assembly protein lptD-Organic solvent tolerance protein [Moritella viscosa]SHO12981.1 LPS-assembly protein lptD-Organic solvent tolerance protein [Moritella viscosa]
MRLLTLFSTLSGVVFSASAATIITNADGTSSILDDSTTPSELSLFKQCYPYVPAIKPPLADTKAANEIQLLSNDAKVIQGNKAIFTGDVNFTQGNRELSADEIILYQLTNILTAEGNVVLEDSTSTINGRALKANLDTKDAELTYVNYLLHGQAGNGEAKKVYITNSGDNILMQRSSYSECPFGDNSWVLRASSIDIDNIDESAEAYNATLYFKDVPIFYMPYFTYPTTDKRRTGLLFPSFENSLENGITFSQPIYWNIAPNYDMEIVPTYMSERGIYLTNKFRYLIDGQSGKINVEYLANDKKTNTDRTLYHWSHNGNFNDNLNFNASYTQVSDNNYFSDLNASAGARDSNTLLRTAALTYNTDMTSSQFEVRDFQILSNSTASTPHKVLPKISFTGYQQFDNNPIELSVYSEITNFTHSNSKMYKGIRTHIEPTISFPYKRPAGFAVAEFKLPMTYYSQTFSDSDNGNFVNGYKGELEEEVVRVIPTARLHAGLNFERSTSWFGNAFTQTLEPQVQYLYIPYKNQDNIGIYDSSTIQQDFLGLYRDRIYSGLDRIADTNQVTVGLTSRVFDKIGSERFRFSLGQIVYFGDSQVGIAPEAKAKADNTEVTTSSIVMETDVKINDNLFFNNSIEYALDDALVRRADAAIEYRFDLGQRVQFNYRYIEDTASILEDANSRVNSTINQVGSKYILPINNQWDMGASYYYDVENKITQDAFVGIKYESCCWAIRLDYGYRLKNHNISTNKTEYDRGPTLMFELKGLGGIGTDMNHIGTSSLFTYGQPFQLRDKHSL